MYLSAEGFKKIKDELEKRRASRLEISQKIQEAKALGDLSENAEYQEALSIQSFNEGKIMEMEEILRRAQLVSQEAGHSHEVVEVSAQIKVESKSGIQRFTIVGSSEADPAKGFISDESPLGKAFLGHKKGDEVGVEMPKGKARYKILEIL